MIRKTNILLIFIIAVLYTAHSQVQLGSYQIKNLNINNEYSNFGTTFYGEDKVVYASPKKKSYIIKNNWKGNNQPFLDLYIGDMADDGELVDVKKFSEYLNTRYHEADVAFSKDKKIVYFSRNNYYNKKLTRDTTGTGLIQLYRAKVNSAGEWIDVEPMPFNNDQYQTGHPTLSVDGKTLYFISDMPGGYGKTDVYKAAINEDGSIGLPINLGPMINTPEREMFASISGNDELYFSSDGRQDGLGGLDIYVTKITQNRMTAPINIGKPINSDKDDFAFILNYETRRGYFSSNRNGGKGDDDIYTFVQDKPIVFDCQQIANGDVKDKNSGQLLPGSLVILYNDKDKEINRTIVGEDARFSFKVDCNQSYHVVGSKEGYSVDEKEFYTTEGNDVEVSLKILLDKFKIERGKCIVKINPIYFDFDKSFIRPDAAIELDKVVEVMNKYPEIIIEGGSHTDSRGTFKYNEDLSARRASATVEYIISKGISPDRITSKGYGETQLVNGCSDGVYCSEVEHQLNRRTEFVITNFEEIKKVYPEICAINVTRTTRNFNIDQQVIEKRKEESIDNTFEFKIDKVLIKINPIYFELNSSYLGVEAIKELNKIVEIMYRYPNIIIECGSHTDSRASDSYNNWLSERRSQRVLNYILSRGISSERISGKGYGEIQLVNKCSDGVSCSEQEHLQNRRTEFKVLNPEMIK